MCIGPAASPLNRRHALPTSTLLAVLALSGCFGADEPSSKAESAATETTLRIADWNLQVNGEGTDGRDGYEPHLRDAAREGRRRGHHHVQRVLRVHDLELRIRLTTDTGVHWYSVTQFDVGSHNHSGVWSRYPFASTPVVYSYSQPASMDTGPKTAGEVDVNVNGTIIHLIVTRLCSPCGGSVRAVQAQDLVALGAGLRRAAHHHGRLQRQPRRFDINTMKAGYTDSFRQAQVDGHRRSTYADNPTGHTTAARTSTTSG